MSRYHWYTVNWSQPILAKIKKEMLKDEYSANRDNGFRVESVRKKSITGRYIERREILDTVDDPLGKTLTYKRVIFDIFRFHISLDFPELELIDPPRRLSRFLIRLSEFSDFNIAVSPIKINLLRFIENIEMNLSQLIVTRVYCSGITLSAKASAKFVISGTEDVRRHMKFLSKNKNMDIDRVRLNCKAEDWSEEFEISKYAVSKFKKAIRPEMITLLRKEIQSAMRNN